MTGYSEVKKILVRRKSHQGSGGWTGGEDSAGDGSGFLPHLAFVLFGGYVPQIHSGKMQDGGELGGRRRLPHQRTGY